MYRDAEKQFKSSLKDQPMIKTVLQLAKVYIRIDQPAAAMATYVKGAELFPGETSMLLGQARIHDALNDMHLGVPLYKEVLKWDASNVEAIACLAANHFYTDQPEIALRFYRRLLMMGVNNTELWNNLGLCCFYASQYDMTLACFERAIKMADDEEAPDVWFNVGQVAIGIGDLGLAYQALKIAVSVDSTHAESFNNLGVLELRKGNVEAGRANFEKASREAEHAFEPAYNHALLAFKTGEFQEAYERVEKALECYPEHADSVELKKQLKKHFTLSLEHHPQEPRHDERAPAEHHPRARAAPRPPSSPQRHLRARRHRYLHREPDGRDRRRRQQHRARPQVVRQHVIDQPFQEHHRERGGGDVLEQRLEPAERAAQEDDEPERDRVERADDAQEEEHGDVLVVGERVPGGGDGKDTLQVSP
eukprot:30864-Pelagococcus_subviridis.AAC.18